MLRVSWGWQNPAVIATTTTVDIQTLLAVATLIVTVLVGGFGWLSRQLRAVQVELHRLTVEVAGKNATQDEQIHRLLAEVDDLRSRLRTVEIDMAHTTTSSVAV